MDCVTNDYKQRSLFNNIKVFSSSIQVQYIINNI